MSTTDQEMLSVEETAPTVLERRASPAVLELEGTKASDTLQQTLLETAEPQPQQGAEEKAGGGGGVFSLFSPLSPEASKVPVVHHHPHYKEKGVPGLYDDEEVVDPKQLQHAKSTVPRAMFNIFKGNVGAGIFLLPTAYKESGYVVGPIFAVIVGLIVIDASLMLVRAKTIIGRETVQTYPQVSQFVLGNIAIMLVNISLILTQFGFVMLYMQFAGNVFEHLAPFAGQGTSYKLYVLFAALIITPFTFFSHKMHRLAIISAFATVCVFYVIFTTFGFTIEKLADNPSSRVVAVDNPANWVLFFASQIGVLEGIGIVLPVENSMKDKTKFPMALKATLGSIVTMYLLYGLTGYLAYGSSLVDSLVNKLLPSAFSSTIKVALATELIGTSPLQFSPAIQIIDMSMGIPPKDGRHKHSRAIAARILIMLLLMTVAMVLPPDTIGLLLAFIGSVAASFLAVILPGMLEVLTPAACDDPHAPRTGAFFKKAIKGECTFRRVRGFFYVFFGIVIMIVGTVTCVIDATKLFGHGVGSKQVPGNNVTDAPAGAADATQGREMLSLWARRLI